MGKRAKELPQRDSEALVIDKERGKKNATKKNDEIIYWGEIEKIKFDGIKDSASRIVEVSDMIDRAKDDYDKARLIALEIKCRSEISKMIDLAISKGLWDPKEGKSDNKLELIIRMEGDEND